MRLKGIELVPALRIDPFKLCLPATVGRRLSRPAYAERPRPAKTRQVSYAELGRKGLKTGRGGPTLRHSPATGPERIGVQKDPAVTGRAQTVAEKK